MKVGSLSELKKILQNRVDKALINDVKETISDVMAEHIVTDVYNVYEPKMYERRQENGGLSDPDNIMTYLESSGRLVMKNITLGDKYYYLNGEKFISQNYNKPIAGIIENGGYGKKYDIPYRYLGYYQPRPFLHNTREDLRKNKQHVSALKKGLKKQGLEVK